MHTLIAIFFHGTGKVFKNQTSAFSVPYQWDLQTKINRVAQEKHDEEEERIMGTNPSLSEAVLVI